MKRTVTAVVAGLIFAFGLALSGMTDPGKVLGFLDITGEWDPSLALVMGGAIGVHFFVARWSMRAKAPLLGGTFAFPKHTDVDSRLVLGAAVFGLGWGIAGFCPGPALVSLGGGRAPVLAFVASMLAAITVFRVVSRGTKHRQAGPVSRMT